MKKVKVGLVGFGMAAKVMHAPFLATTPGYEVVSVLERHKEESKQLFPHATIVRNLEDLLNTDIDLVVITTPNETHFPYAHQSLNAGKHVVLEKPFTITSEDALELISTASKANKLLTVYQNRRYVADFLTIKEILKKKILGNIHRYEAYYDRYRPEPKENAWREEAIPGSGILYDLGSHLIDQACCLFGLPEAITADIRTQRAHAKVDDCFDISLHYSYTKATLKASMLVLETGPKFMIHGTLGSFIKYGEDPQEARLKNNELPNTPDWGKENESEFGLLHSLNEGVEIRKKHPSLAGNFGLFYQHLYRSIIFGEELKEKPEQGYNTIRLIELAFESNHKKATIPCDGLLSVDYR